MKQLLALYLLIISICNASRLHSNLHSISTLRRLYDNFHHVERGKLYRSGQLASKQLAKYIKKYKFKTIINLRGPNPQMLWWRKETDMANKHNVTMHNIPMTSKRFNDKKHIVKLLKLYKTAQKPILIHCHEGADRTGEAAALWKLEIENKSKKEALKQLSFKYHYIRSRKPTKFQCIRRWQGIENYKR